MFDFLNKKKDEEVDDIKKVESTGIDANVVLETTGGIGEEITIDENTIELVEDGEIDENNE